MLGCHSSELGHSPGQRVGNSWLLYAGSTLLLLRQVLADVVFSWLEETASAADVQGLISGKKIFIPMK